MNEALIALGAVMLAVLWWRAIKAECKRQEAGKAKADREWAAWLAEKGRDQ